MQHRNDSDITTKNPQEKDGFLLPVLLTVWRELRSLILLNFTLDIFVVFPTLLLMGLNLDWPIAVIVILLILSVASVVSIPAALCAANRITVSMVRQENFFLNHDFWKTFAENYGKALLGGLFYSAVLGVLGFSGYCAYMMFGGTMLFFVVLAVVLAFGIVFFLAGLYFWPMLALIDLPVKPIIKNSLLIVPACWKRSLLAIAATLFIGIFLMCFTIGTALFLAGFVFFALYLLLVNFAVYPGISRLVILRESPKKTNTMIKQLDGQVLTWEEEDETGNESKNDTKNGEKPAEEKNGVKIEVDKTPVLEENKIPDGEPGTESQTDSDKTASTKLDLKWEE